MIDYKKEDFARTLRDYDVVLNSLDKTTLENPRPHPGERIDAPWVVAGARVGGHVDDRVDVLGRADTSSCRVRDEQAGRASADEHQFIAHGCERRKAASNSARFGSATEESPQPRGQLFLRQPPLPHTSIA